VPESAGVVLEGRPEKENNLGTATSIRRSHLAELRPHVGISLFDSARFSNSHTHTADTLWPPWVSVCSHKLFSTRPGDS
jgi:hypothetical protein